MDPLISPCDWKDKDKKLLHPPKRTPFLDPVLVKVFARDYWNLPDVVDHAISADRSAGADKRVIPAAHDTVTDRKWRHLWVLSIAGAELFVLVIYGGSCKCFEVGRYFPANPSPFRSRRRNRPRTIR